MFRTPGFALLLSVVLAACSSAPRFTTAPDTSVPSGPHQLQGIASYYADEFNGRTTANGEVFDMHAMTAAHRSLPFDTRVKVRNLENGREVIVRINDRGPFVDNRVIDLSLGAAREIGLVASGTAPVQLEIIQLGPQH